MAVDWKLMQEIGATPLLRLYRWSGDWVSYGYFQEEEAARKIFGEGPAYVRRPTGGGVVDHRADATYTLVVPRGERVAGLRGDASYRCIHGALVDCLLAAGAKTRLADSCGEAASAACFEAPVCWDVLDEAGRKIAGAGQRRTRQGLLHQGSVAVAAEKLDLLAEFFAEEVEEIQYCA